MAAFVHEPVISSNSENCVRLHMVDFLNLLGGHELGSSADSRLLQDSV